jgi:hypothetical protein
LTEHSSAQGTINNVLIILKYYIYVCRCKCRDFDLEGGLEFLKYAINIEKASMIYLSPVQKEHAKRKWLDLVVEWLILIYIYYTEIYVTLYNLKCIANFEFQKLLQNSML